MPARSLALLAIVLASSFLGCPLGRGSKKVGEPCESNTQCARSHCAAGLCTAACKSDGDCVSAGPAMVCTMGAPVAGFDAERWGLCTVAKAP